MKLEKGIISSSQLIFLIIGAIQGSILISAYAYGVTRHNVWIVTIMGLFVSVILSSIYIALLQRFPGKNLIEINDIIYGVYLGKVISAAYISFFFLIVIYNLRYVGDFLVTNLFKETPIVVFIIIFILLCIWVVREGLEVIARISPILVVVTLIGTLVITLLIIKDMQLSNFLPIYELKFSELVQGTHIISSIPLSRVQVLLLIAAYINDTKQVKRSMLTGLILGGIYLLVISLRNIAVLGVLGHKQTSPTYRVAELINVGKIITRVELLTSMMLLFTMFLTICIYYYISVLGTAQLLKLRSYKPLTIPFGIIAITLSISMFDNPLEEAYAGENIHPIFTIPFQFFIPLISLIISKVRKL